MFSIPILIGCQNPIKSDMYKFSDPQNTACFTCTHVLNEKNPILYVSHDFEGDWQFLCGAEHHKSGDAAVISLKEAYELDQTINYLYEMPRGVAAERTSVKSKWVPFKLPE